MNKKKILFKKIYIITILVMLFTTALAGMQAMASTDSQEGKVHWESNTKDEEIQVPDGVTGDGGKWDSSTYTSAYDKANNTNIETKPMSEGEQYGAIVAALIGVLAISAAKSSSSESAPTVSEGNGIWVPESDRDAVTEMINKAASKQYYIDADGFVKEVPGAIENPSKSSTYSSVLDRLIGGDNKVVIGVGDGWVSSGENGLESNAFTGNNSGITIGDNGTPQVVVVSGKDIPESSADITLAHELTHALRGEEGIKSINTIGGINQDEEAHTIEVENMIREELGYEVRTDGDISDGGDGSYGKYSDSSEEDWYNKIDEMQGSDTLSGNAYSNWYSYAAPGSNFSPAHPDAPHITVYDDIDDLRDALSNESGGDDDDDCDCDCDCDCEWGSNYDDSIWSKGGRVSVVNNVVSGSTDWGSFSVPKRNWDTFFRSNSDTKKTLSGINTAVSTYKDKNKIVITESVNMPTFGWDIPAEYYDENNNSIYQVGCSIAVAYGFRGDVSIAYVYDLHGNCDIQITGGAGLGSPGGGVSAFTTKIKADDIPALKGKGTNGGGSYGLWGLDFTSSDTSEGVTQSYNLGSFDLTGETHIEKTYTVSGNEVVNFVVKGAKDNYLKELKDDWDELIDGLDEWGELVEKNKSEK